GGYLTHVNLDQQDVIGIFVSAPLNIARWWNTFTDAGICRTRNQADFGMEGKTIDMAQTTWQVYHQSTFNLPADFAIELSGFYNAPALWGANFQTKGFGGMDIGASKRFLDGRGSVKMAVTDVFHTMQWAGSQSYGGLEFEGRGGWESRQFKVNVTYRFGSEQFKRGGKRKTGLDDVQGRA
ncbi:MAG: outer membrane beta-barrel protein, partial [Bacteroidota bacterium]